MTGQLDHDLGNSSFPRFPLQVMVPMDRAAQLADIAVRDALLRVLRALDRDLVPEVRGTLRALTYHGPDSVGAVLGSLDAFVEGGEGS
jgi:hypothetical protein